MRDMEKLSCSWFFGIIRNFFEAELAMFKFCEEKIEEKKEFSHESSLAANPNAFPSEFPQLIKLRAVWF